MKLQDVIRALQANIPFETDFFTDSFNITKIDVSGSDLTVTTDSPHGINSGDGVMLVNVKNKLPVANFKQVNNLATLEFSNPHGFNFDPINTQFIALVDHNDPNDDGNYLLIDVPDEKTLVIDVKTQVLEPGLSVLTDEGFSGVYVVADVPSATMFTIEARKDIYTKPAVASGGHVKTRIRIAGTADFDRFVASYTKQPDKKCWIVVTPPGNRTSKSRNVSTDAIGAIFSDGQGVSPVDIRFYMLESLEVYIVVPATEEIAGRQAVDIAEDCRWALYKSLCGAYIPTLSASADIYALLPVVDGYFQYLSDNTTYVHRFEFERSVTLTRDDMTPDKSQTAPFVDVELTVDPCDCFKLKK